MLDRQSISVQKSSTVNHRDLSDWQKVHWRGRREKKIMLYFTRAFSQVHWGPKESKAFQQVPLPRVFLLPLSVHIRNYMNSICRIFFCEYHIMLMVRLLHGIIIYQEQRHVVNKLKFWKYCLEVGKEVKESVIMMWGDKPTLQPCF